MTLPVTDRIAGPYSCNGTLDDFDFAFKVFTTADIRVVKTSAAGVEMVLVLDSDYTVVLNTDQQNDPGGTVTTSSAYATGFTVTIDGNLSYGQTAELTNLGGFFPKVIEKALDRVVILCQQLKKLMDRSIKLAVSDTISSTELPSAAQRASRVLGFDVDGNLTTHSVTTTVYGQVVERFTATASQTIFNLSHAYVPGVDAIAVFQNGLRLRGAAIDYTETTSTRITLTTGATVGDEIDIIVGQEAASSASLSTAVAHTPTGGAPTTNVSAYLNLLVKGLKRDFGAVGDGVTNDTAAIVAALAASKIIEVEPGTYLSDPIVFSGVGRKWIGAGAEGTGAAGATGTGSTIKARGVQADLLRLSGFNHEISGITFNGNFTTAVVVRVVTPTDIVHFMNCRAERATAATGRLVYLHSTYSGATSQIGHFHIDNCILQQDVSNWANRCLHAFEIVGSNAFLNTIENSWLAGAENGAKITDSAGVFLHNVEAEYITVCCVLFAGTQGYQPVEIDGLYTETLDGSDFIFMPVATGAQGNHSIRLNNLVMNTPNANITLDLIQPISISNSYVSGNIVLNAVTAGFTAHPLVADNINFAATKNFTGANAGRVVKRNVTVNKVAQRDTVVMGASLLNASIPGTALVNTTAVGNVGGGADLLMQYEIPANALNAAGKGINFEATGSYANNANAKTLTVQSGATAVILSASLTVNQAGRWKVTGSIRSTGTDTQKVQATLTQSGTVSQILDNATTGTDDDGAVFYLAFYGTGTADNDIVQDGLTITYL